MVVRRTLNSTIALRRLTPALPPSHGNFLLHPRMTDIDIYRFAKLLIAQHAADAATHAAMRVVAMLEQGDMDGQAVWKRIVRAVEELQGPRTRH